MTSKVTDILGAIETRVNAVLPSYTRLKYSYDVEKNDKRTSDNAYGVGAGSATSVTGPLKTVTMDQTFFVVLSKDFGGRNNDTAERTALKALYDDIELLYADFYQSKLGLNATVFLVSELALDEPVKMGQNVISVRMNFLVKHRVST